MRYLIISLNQEKSFMRYTDRFKIQAISQWRQCYLNYEHLKLLVLNIRDGVRQRIELQSIKNYKTHLQARTQKTITLSSMQLQPHRSQQIYHYYTYFIQISNKSNQMFCQAYRRNVELYGLFVRWKHTQIQTNFFVCWKAHFMMEQSQKDMQKILISYIQYLFVQSIFLSRMVQSNLQAEMRIFAKYNLYQNNLFPHLQALINKQLAIDICHKLRRHIQRFYFRINKRPKQKNRYKLRKLAQTDLIQTKQTLVIGFLIGAVLTVIVFMCIILARANITLQTNQTFNADFVLWRGISIFIFYIWVLGLDLTYFEKYKISFRIIFKDNYPKHPISTDLFRVAGVFSIIFIVVFTIYSLQVTGILQLGALNYQWLPLLVWAPFVLFLINPIPIFYHYGRRFFFKTLFYGLLSVFLFVDFPKVWVVAQALSLLNVFQDLVYTVCFYTHLNLLQTPNQTNRCRTPAVQARFVYTIIIYLIRIIQCIKVGFGQCQVQWKKTQFLNAIKFCFALLTAILSYIYSQNNNNKVFIAWIIFAIISTICSFVWDCLMGWDLFYKKCDNFLLRDELLYPKRNYYIWIIVNLILRFAWTMNISPAIFNNIFGSPEIFNLVFGFLQIMRRGMWNLVRVQVQQIRNNNALQALSKQKQDLQTQLYDFVNKNKLKMNQASLENLITSQKRMIQVKQQRKNDLKKDKQNIVKQINQYKSFSKNQKKIAYQIKQTNENNLKHMMQTIYQ